MRKNIKNNNKGIAALLSVVLIGAVTLLLAKNSAVIGRADLDIVNNNILSSIAMSNAESCLEESLRQIQMDANFTSSGLSLSLEKGACLANVNQSGGIYNINSEGRIYSYLKIIEAQASWSDERLRIDAWENK